MLKPGDSLGRLRKALCYLCACLVLRRQLTGGAWPWAGPLQSFLMALLGLQFPAVAHFGVICSSNPTARTPVPSRAVLGAGSSRERGLCWAGEAQISQVKWSSPNTCD